MKPRCADNLAGRRGTVLIVTMLVAFALAGMTLVLCRSMAVEAIAAANQASAIRAQAIERAAEQYVLGLLASEGPAVLDLSEDYFAAVPLGEGYFWILRPDYGDPDLPLYGLVDECSKLDLNTATYDELILLPGMTDDVTAAIVDWRDSDSSIDPHGGAESEYYLTLPEPYNCKNGPLETVEELLLVRGFSRQLLYGDQSSPLGEVSVFQSSGRPTYADQQLARGLYDLLTVYSLSPGNNNRPVRGRINLNTATRPVLLCVLTSDQVDRLLAARRSRSAGSTDISWATQAVPNLPVARFTGQSYRYSADILAASGDGRAFVRCRIVVDTQSSPPRIIYRRDLTDRGWPMQPQILDSLRRKGALQS